MMGFNPSTFIVTAFILVNSISIYANDLYHNDINNKKCCLVINHALGGIDGNAYTNSLEALLRNIKNGSLIFEVDLSKTSDGVWVATHDWKSWSRRTNNPDTHTPELKEFLQTRIVQEDGKAYTTITLKDLETVILRHPKVKLITDTKYNLQELEAEISKYKIKNRIIWQAYNFDDIDFLKSKGYTNIILTLYKFGKVYPAAFAKIINTKYSKSIIAVTMPLQLYQSKPWQKNKLSVPIYLHGRPENINSRQLHLSLSDQISGFYLD